MAFTTTDGGTTEGIADMFVLPETVQPEMDASVAAWVTESLASQPWPTVRGSVPDRFEAYARILHPAYPRTGDLTTTPVRWAEVAAQTGRTVHRLAQFERLAAGPDDPNAQPSWGHEPDAWGVCVVASPLLPILRAHTSSADRCVFGVWEGYGGMDMVPFVGRAARAQCPHRDYALFSGPIDGFFAFCRSPWEPPSIWWPEDRTWFVSTDIDLDGTYVGGSSACIETILGDQALEAFPAYPDDRIDVGADEINPPAGGGLR
jgi:hypothetical protein